MQILEIALLSNDIPATRAFYQQVLGLAVARESPASVTFVAGASLLSFNRVINSSPVYHYAFNIPPTQLSSTLEILKQKTEIIAVSDTGELIADFKSWNAKSFYFRDNNGNILECIARLDLAEQVESTANHPFILNISEIGFVVPDVPAVQQQLQQHGVPAFSKGPQGPEFSVLGDNLGLIILKDPDRGWMPDLTKPQSYETHALVLEEGQKLRLSLKAGALEIFKIEKEFLSAGS